MELPGLQVNDKPEVGKLDAISFEYAFLEEAGEVYACPPGGERTEGGNA